MKRFKIFSLLLIIGLTGPGLIRKSVSQETIFSQYFNNPVFYNPGLIGADMGLKIRLQYRDQWANLPGDFKTVNFNMDVAERHIPGSGGLALMMNRKQEGQGFLEKSIIGIGTAVRIPLADNVVSQLGVMANFVEQKINWDNLIFTDQLDPRYGEIYNTNFVPPDGGNGTIRYPDINLGTILRFFPEVYNADKMVGTLGFAVHHSLSPDDSYLGIESKVPRRYVAHGDLLWINSQGASYRRTQEHYSGVTKYNFGVLYEMTRNRNNYAIGLNMLRSNIYIGAWYKGESYGAFQSNSMVFLAGINYSMGDNVNMKVMYSYDWDLNELVSISGPTHEITLSFQLNNVMLFGSGDSYSKYAGSSFRRGGIITEPMECSPF
jgi:type IX secretion system PorP/SprF family membrane protein